MKKLLILITALSFAITLNAADFDIYGKMGMSAWWMKSEGLHMDTLEWDSLNNPIDHEDSIPINTNMMTPFGTLGFKFKGGVFGGCIEMNTRMNTYDSKLSGSPTYMVNFKKRRTFISMEKWYAEWYINEFMTLLMGQDYAPTNFFPSNHAFNGGTGLHDVGCLYTGAYPMFQLSIHDGNKIFEGKVAAIKVDTTCINYLDESSHSVHHHCETKAPKVEGSFAVNFDKEFFGVNGKVAGGFQQYNTIAYKKQIIEDKCRLAVTSYVVGGDVGAKVGPAKLSCDVFYGQNIGAYGVSFGYEWGWWRINDYMRPYFPIHEKTFDTTISPTDTTIDTVGVMRNCTTLEVAGILNVKPLEWLAFEGGGGVILGEHEYKYFDDKWKMVYAWYFQAEVKIFEQLVITPEVGQYNFEKNRGFIYWGLNSLVEF